MNMAVVMIFATVAAFHYTVLQFFVFLSRYLAQVMIDFPKPIVAALKKPAQGLGAKLVSLCDLVCDEVSKYIPLINNNNTVNTGV